jgi:riboflavin biosynthesis pyrimidine reductase
MSAGTTHEQGDPLAQPLLRLYPPPHEAVALPGLYLAHRLHARGGRGRPVVYSNFISSLDGRIALPDPVQGVHRVPKAVANPRDWRLFQELAAQADLLVTSGRYFRDLARGGAQAPLPVSRDPRHADLRRWRAAHGLAAQPAVAVLSASLDVPIHPGIAREGRPLYVFTGRGADPARARALQRQGAAVHFAGSGRTVDGARLLHRLGGLGFRSIYCIAGPQVLHTLLSAGALDRLYLTLTHQLIGGVDYDTLLHGQAFDPPVPLALAHLYYDPYAPVQAGQLIAVFERQSQVASAK